MNDSEKYDKECMKFYGDTGIWPVGKDSPPAMGEQSDRDVRFRAFNYWQNSKAKNKKLKVRIETLEAVIKVLQMNGAMINNYNIENFNNLRERTKEIERQAAEALNQPTDKPVEKE